MPTHDLARRPGLLSLISQLRDVALPCCVEAAEILEGLIKAPALIPDELSVDLNRGIAQRGGVTVAVTPNQAVLLHTLNLAAGAVVQLEDMHKAIYGGTMMRVAPRTNNNIRTQVNALRNRVAMPLCLTVRTYFGEGYSLELLPMRKEDDK